MDVKVILEKVRGSTKCTWVAMIVVGKLSFCIRF